MLNKTSGIDPKLIKKDYSEGKKRTSVLRALYLPSPTFKERNMDNLTGPDNTGKTEAMKKGDGPAYVNERKRWNLKIK